MKAKTVYTILLLFVFLLVLILSSKTIWSLCTTCGVQDFERSMFGKKVELISTREVDEHGTYANWKKEHNKLCNHQWVVVDEFSDQIQNHIDNLK